MSVIQRSSRFPSWRTMLANYIGGLGYYAWHMAWMVVTLLVFLRGLQFLLFKGQTLLYVPAQTAQYDAPPASTGLLSELLLSILTAVLVLAVVVFVVCLPYWIGYMSRSLPRWCLAQTSWKLIPRNLYRTKLIATAAVFVCAVPVLYYPGAAAHANIGFFFVSVLCLVAFICFWLQYLCTTLWKIPERHRF